MAVMDVFNSDLFSEISLTDTINNLPFSPGQATRAVDWQENGVTTTTIFMESKGGTLGVVNPSPRGAPGDAVPKAKRTGQPVVVPHYQIDDGIYADEVQNLRAYGQESGLQSLQTYVSDRLNEIIQLYMDPTTELQRLGALRGLILNGDGSTLLDLFAAFGVTQSAEVDFNLDGATADGAVRATCAAVVRLIATALGGRNFGGVRALASPEFYDALIKNVEVRATYLNQQGAAELRTGYAYGTFHFGGIDFEEYRGSGSMAIAANKVHIFPVGVPGLYRTVYAPADYNDTVNTIGLPRYARRRERDDEKGWHLEVQTNALSYVTRPAVLIKGKTT